ncbi:DUF4256 domain-containing protein [Arachidicoccus sp.]|uniref:DUF4256 domain-containing protein n=1 Tax=Arachidicoccus sp. TaxID=1872624 RepID=UPI003D22844A
MKFYFEKNEHRHKNLKWSEMDVRRAKQLSKFWSINEMGITGGARYYWLREVRKSIYLL